MTNAQPIHDYESKHRNHISSKNWARIHETSDRREPIALGERVRRIWR